MTLNQQRAKLLIEKLREAKRLDKAGKPREAIELLENMKATQDLWHEQWLDQIVAEINNESDPKFQIVFLARFGCCAEHSIELLKEILERGSDQELTTLFGAIRVGMAIIMRSTNNRSVDDLIQSISDDV